MPILHGHWLTERRFLACEWKRQAGAAAVFANDYCGEAPTPRLTCSMRRSGYFGPGWMKPSAIFSRGRTVRAQRSNKPPISRKAAVGQPAKSSPRTYVFRNASDSCLKRAVPGTYVQRQQRTSREGLANVGDKIVRKLDPDRHANQ